MATKNHALSIPNYWALFAIIFIKNTAFGSQIQAKNGPNLRIRPFAVNTGPASSSAYGALDAVLCQTQTWTTILSETQGLHGQGTLEDFFIFFNEWIKQSRIPRTAHLLLKRSEDNINFF